MGGPLRPVLAPEVGATPALAPAPGGPTRSGTTSWPGPTYRYAPQGGPTVRSAAMSAGAKKLLMREGAPMRTRRRTSALAIAAGLVVSAGAGAAAAASAPAIGPQNWPVFGLYLNHNAVWGEGPAVNWQRTTGAIANGLIVAAGRVYYGTDTGYAECLSARTGRLIWKTKLDNWVFGPPTLVDGRVFVGTGTDVFAAPDVKGTPPSTIYALSAATGAILWRVDTGGEDKPSITYADGYVYAADGHGSLRKIDPATGNVVWKVADGGIAAVSPPTPYQGRIYLETGTPGHPGLRAFSARTGERLWTYPEGNSDNMVTVGDGLLFAVNTLPIRSGGKSYLEDQYEAVSFNGHLVWRYTTRPGPMPVFEAPGGTEFGGVFYDGSMARPYLYAFDARTGRLRWKTRMPGGLVNHTPLVTRHYVLAVTNTAWLVAMNRSTGKIVAQWHYAANSSVGPGALTMVNHTLYLWSSERGGSGSVLGRSAVKGRPLTRGSVYAIAQAQLLSHRVPTGG